MTMGLCFTTDKDIYIAADKRTSRFRNDGKFERVISDDAQKVIILGENTALFIGGLTSITEKIKNEINSMKFESYEEIEKTLTRLCSEGHESHKEQIKNLSRDMGTVVCILATFKNNRPVQIGFMAEYDFKPVEYYNNSYLNFKSSNDKLADAVIQAINKTMLFQLGGVDPIQLLKRTFELVSISEKTISPTCDIYKVSADGITEITQFVKTINEVKNKEFIDVHLMTAGTIRGIEMQQISDNGTMLMQVFKDTYGGVMKVYDINGFLNAKIGVEAGTADNQGGTLVLYMDSPIDTSPGSLQFQRVEIGIVSGSGISNYRDNNAKARVSISADSDFPYIGVRDSNENPVSYLAESAGYINSQRIATINEVMQLINQAISEHISQYHQGV